MIPVKVVDLKSPDLQACGTNCACTQGANQNSFPMSAGVVGVHLVLIGDGILLATVRFLPACATLQPNVALPHSSFGLPSPRSGLLGMSRLRSMSHGHKLGSKTIFDRVLMLLALKTLSCCCCGSLPTMADTRMPRLPNSGPR